MLFIWYPLYKFVLWLIAFVSCFTKANGVYYNQTNFKEKSSGLVWWSLILIYIVEILKAASQANCNQVQKQVFYCAPASLTPATGEPFKVTQESPIHISGWDLYHSFKEQNFSIFTSDILLWINSFPMANTHIRCRKQGAFC